MRPLYHGRHFGGRVPRSRWAPISLVWRRQCSTAVQTEGAVGQPWWVRWSAAAGQRLRCRLSTCSGNCSLVCSLPAQLHPTALQASHRWQQHKGRAWLSSILRPRMQLGCARCGMRGLAAGCAPPFSGAKQPVHAAWASHVARLLLCPAMLRWTTCSAQCAPCPAWHPPPAVCVPRRGGRAAAKGVWCGS